VLGNVNLFKSNDTSVAQGYTINIIWADTLLILTC